MAKSGDVTLGYDAEWFVDVLDALSEFVLVKGPASRLLWANKAFRAYYGLSNEQLAGLVDAPEVPPDMTLKYVRDDHEVFSAQRRLVINEPITKHDGSVAHYRTIKTPIVRAGLTERTVGSSRPLVDEAAVAHSARERHERFDGLVAMATLLDTLPTTAALVDVHGALVATSRSFRAAFDLDEEGLVGTTFAVALGERLPVTDSFAVVLDGGIHVEREIHAANQIYNVSLRPWQPREGETTGVFIVCENVTELHRARGDAKARGRELEELVNTLGTGVIAVDENAKFLVYNKEAQRLAPGDPSEGESEKWAESFGIFTPDGQMMREDEIPLVRALNGHTTRDRLVLLRRPDEQDTWVNVSAYPVDAGRFRAVVNFSDVTALIQTQRELEQFAYVASHDLQEPLRMVRSYVQLLDEDLKIADDDPLAEYMHFIKDGAERMSRLVRDLLEFSRAGATTLEMEDVDLGGLLDELEGELALAIEESGAKIDRESTATVHGDRAQLKQLLGNLLKNAIKFRDASRPPRVAVAVREDARAWRIDVKDNGIGFDTRFTEKVFRMFQRLHRREDYPGTGIGLAICKRVVERHGGQINVVAEPGRGAHFWVTLPKRSAASREEAP